LVGPDDEIGPSTGAGEALPPELGDTADDPDEEAAVSPEDLEPAEIGIELGLGFCPDRAGVDDDHVARRLVLDGDGPGRDEPARQALGVVLVHLAAERPEGEAESAEGRVRSGHHIKASAISAASLT
jgi:hypothetical protein